MNLQKWRNSLAGKKRREVEDMINISLSPFDEEVRINFHCIPTKFFDALPLVNIFYLDEECRTGELKIGKSVLNFYTEREEDDKVAI